MGLTSDDIKVIWASARKIYRDASFLRDGNRRHDLTMEALAIMTLCEAVIGKQQIEVELDLGSRDIPSWVSALSAASQPRRSVVALTVG